MLISILAGPRFIAFLRRKEYGQTIREEGPEHHVTKQGTPIMGGLLILGAGTAAYLALARYSRERSPAATCPRGRPSRDRRKSPSSAPPSTEWPRDSRICSTPAASSLPGQVPICAR